jgi:hypothetical protein
MRAHGGVDVETSILLTSTVVSRQWAASRPGRFIPWERTPVTHPIGGWTDSE